MMLYSFVYGRRLYIHHKLSSTCFLCSEKPPGYKQVGKKYKDLQYEAMRKKMPRKDIWGDLWRKDTIMIAEIHGVICQLKFVYMENWHVMKNLPSVPCYALRGLFDHRRVMGKDVLNDIRRKGVEDDPGWGRQYLERKKSFAQV